MREQLGLVAANEWEKLESRGTGGRVGGKEREWNVTKLLPVLVGCFFGQNHFYLGNDFAVWKSKLRKEETTQLVSQDRAGGSHMSPQGLAWTGRAN